MLVSQSLWCAWCWGVRFCGVHDACESVSVVCMMLVTCESVSAVCMMLVSQFMWCGVHDESESVPLVCNVHDASESVSAGASCWWISGVHDDSESISAVCMMKVSQFPQWAWSINTTRSHNGLIWKALDTFKGKIWHKNPNPNEATATVQVWYYMYIPKTLYCSIRIFKMLKNSTSFILKWIWFIKEKDISVNC